MVGSQKTNIHQCWQFAHVAMDQGPSHLTFGDLIQCLGGAWEKKSRLTIPEQSWRRWWWWWWWGGGGGGELFGTIIPFTFKKKNTWCFFTNPSEKSYATVKLHCITSARFARWLFSTLFVETTTYPAVSPSFSHNHGSVKNYPGVKGK